MAGFLDSSRDDAPAASRPTAQPAVRSEDHRRFAASVVDRPLGEGFDLEEHLNAIHREYLRRAMKEAKGVKTRASRLLGMKNYQTLDAQLKRLDVTGVWDE